MRGITDSYKGQTQCLNVLLSYPTHFLVIGTILPLPKDLALTFNTNPICQRLCSLPRIFAFDWFAITSFSNSGDKAS